MNTPFLRTVLIAGVALAFTSGAFAAQAASSRQAPSAQSTAQAFNARTVALPWGCSAVLRKNGVTGIFAVSNKAEIRTKLVRPSPRPYALGDVIVVYGNGITGSRDVVNVSVARLKTLHRIWRLAGTITPSQAPHYTTSAALNVLLARLGVDQSTRLFSHFSKSRLQAMSKRASATSNRKTLDIGNAYELQVTGVSVEQAVAALRSSGLVTYASPAFHVTTLHTRSEPGGHRVGNSPTAGLTPAAGATNTRCRIPYFWLPSILLPLNL